MPAETTTIFTDSEQKLFIAMMANLRGDIDVSDQVSPLKVKLTLHQVDWEAVCADTGYANARCARMRWSQIKSKKVKGIGKVSARDTKGKKKGASKQNAGGPIGSDFTAINDMPTPEGTPSPAAKKRGCPAKMATTDDIEVKLESEDLIE